MAIESDVLVVGGGLAGCMAALSASREGGDVLLVSHKQSTLRHASGLIDVLGYHEGELVTDPFAVIEALPTGHPYERAGIDAVRDGLSLFDSVVDGYEGHHTDRNALVPTFGGTVKPTARYPRRCAAGLASDPVDTLLVGFETVVDFDAELAASHLASAGVPFETRGVTVDFPVDLRADAKLTRYAHLLDRDETVDGSVGIRRALAREIESHLDGESRVGLPALLGDDNPSAVRETLAAHLGVEVFEIPMGPPSLPGLHLEEMLFDALDEAGVRIETGNPVVDVVASEGAVDQVLVERTHQTVPYSADQYVLATGGLVGKGLDSDRETVREPVFDCHVAHPEDRYEWAAKAAFGDHEFARFGVDVDRELRPQTANGDLEYWNLRAAGGVIGGADFPAEKSGSGISIATGYRAGRLAT